jgi:DNA-binding PadR family transcriptional regulator
MAKRRKVGNLLGLQLLAALVERPMHPYEMATVLRERGKDHDTKINWGSLYTVVQNLERHGFIEAVDTTRAGRRPERTVYRLTPAGRSELDDWLREILGVPDPEFPRLRTGLSVVGILGPDEVMSLLDQRLRALDEEVAAGTAMMAELGLPRVFLVEMEYYLAIRRAEAEWVRGFVAELRDGTLPGLTAWRTFHETGVVPDEIA